MARKSPRDEAPSEDGFAPLHAGIYATGGQLNGRVQVLRGNKPAVYLPLAKLAEHEASGEIEVFRSA